MVGERGLRAELPGHCRGAGRSDTRSAGSAAVAGAAVSVGGETGGRRPAVGRGRAEQRVLRHSDTYQVPLRRKFDGLGSEQFRPAIEKRIVGGGAKNRTDRRRCEKETGNDAVDGRNGRRRCQEEGTISKEGEAGRAGGSNVQIRVQVIDTLGNYTR